MTEDEKNEGSDESAQAHEAAGASAASGSRSGASQLIGSDAFRDFARQQSAIGRITGSDAFRDIARQQSALSRLTELQAAPGLVSMTETLSAGILRQLDAFYLHKTPHLGLRVDQAAESWARALQPRSVAQSQPESLAHVGLAASAVIDTAHILSDTYESESASYESVDEEWRLARNRETEDFVSWLESIDVRLADKYKGAWHTLSGQGPDWISQSANSAVELIDWTLRSLAEENDVLKWQQTTGKYADELGDNGRPHRALRIRYIATQRGISPSATELAIKAITGTLKELQKMKHADGEVMRKALRSALLGTEHGLLILRGAGPDV